MQGKDFILSKLESILRDIKAEQVELVYQFKDNQLTRFANNYIHQNIAEKDGTLTIKTVNGKKVSSAVVNSLDPEVINSAVKRIQDNEKFQPDDIDFVSLPKPENITEIISYDEETINCSPEKRAEYVKIITDQAEKYNVNASGQCSTTATELAIVNSLGIRAYNISTEAQLLSMVIEQMEGYSSLSSQSISKINPYLVAEESVSKCVNSRNPVEIEPDFYPVVLQSYGVAQLVELLGFENFNATVFKEGRSCVSGKIGEKITGDLISIYNDPTDTEGLPMPFDMEGLPRKKVVLIEKGIARGIVHNSYTANQVNEVSTGNKSGTTLKTPYTMNLTMSGGNDSVEKMIESIEYGLYVTRLNYINGIDYKQTVNTGLTRGGTFLIENGKITKPVYNLRFTDSTLKLFNNISMLSAERRIGGEYSPVLAPTVKIDRFRFTGKTKPGE